jgi:hypothetical protein
MPGQYTIAGSVYSRDKDGNVIVKDKVTGNFSSVKEPFIVYGESKSDISLQCDGKDFYSVKTDANGQFQKISKFDFNTGKWNAIAQDNKLVDMQFQGQAARDLMAAVEKVRRPPSPPSKVDEKNAGISDLNKSLAQLAKQVNGVLAAQEGASPVLTVLSDNQGGVSVNSTNTNVSKALMKTLQELQIPFSEKGGAISIAKSAVIPSEITFLKLAQVYSKHITPINQNNSAQIIPTLNDVLHTYVFGTQFKVERDNANQNIVQITLDPNMKDYSMRLEALIKTLGNTSIVKNENGKLWINVAKMQCPVDQIAKGLVDNYQELFDRAKNTSSPSAVPAPGKHY